MTNDVRDERRAAIACCTEDSVRVSTSQDSLLNQVTATRRRPLPRHEGTAFLPGSAGYFLAAALKFHCAAVPEQDAAVTLPDASR
ncbi:hypothetical protein Lesp01_29370 [Lentzea sp. NBRC 102530]|nr:hypothetical protein Lesp01_29370 [Lentzea sp. NBRC 102530]